MRLGSGPRTSSMKSLGVLATDVDVERVPHRNLGKSEASATAKKEEATRRSGGMP
jgi:hypothetical protein